MSLHYSPYGGYGYRRRGAFWIIFLLIIVVIAVPLSISLSLRYGTDIKETDNTGEYALTDKVIRTYNHDFCQGLQAKSTSTPKNNAAQSNATLYLLNRYPLLSTDNEKFSFSKRVRFVSEGDYFNWNFYLNVGSNVHFNACYDSDSTTYSSITLYVIKGSKNFNRWMDDPDDPDNVVRSPTLNSPCTNISYSVSESDRYYFAFYSRTFSRFWLDIDSQFMRRVYDIPPDSIVHDCTIPLDGHSSCSIGVPMSSGYTAVLSLNTTPPVDFSDDGADIQISCQPRAWLYAVIVLCTVLPVTVIVILVIVCVCVVVKRGRRKYTPLVGNDDQTAKDAFEDSANVNAPIRSSVVVTTGSAPAPTANSPTFNPAYPSQAGGYGTTAPPTLPVYTE